MTSGSAPMVEVTALVTDISNSFSSVRQVVKSLRQNESTLDTRAGISLMSLKHNLLLLYLESLSLITARRAIGHHLGLRSPPLQAITASDRDTRGSGAGDLVDATLECRVVLERMKALETRMRYQMDKLLRLAQEPDKREKIADDPLAFGPNPENFVNEQPAEDEIPDGDVETMATSGQDGIYRPPRLAPVPYVEPSKAGQKRRAPVPSALAALLSDPTRPHAESTSGLGSAFVSQSGRAAHIRRLQEYEEENFTRMVMKKADARRRARDEADLAMGGGLGTSGRRNRMQAGTLEDAFGDVLRGIERKGGRTEDGFIRDGYEELRRKSGKGNALERSRMTGKRDASSVEHVEGDNTAGRKRTRFELESKTARKKFSKRKLTK